jgi:hypothetical protein
VHVCYFFFIDSLIDRTSRISVALTGAALFKVQGRLESNIPNNVRLVLFHFERHTGVAPARLLFVWPAQ